MNYKQKVGKFGENLAKNYLINKGYKIIEQNYQNSYQEVDILANFRGETVFIEVKTRTSNTFGRADEAVSERKINNLLKVMDEYLFTRKIDPDKARLDLIAIDINKLKKVAKIRHYRNII
jgi:putative endonuclease